MLKVFVYIHEENDDQQSSTELDDVEMFFNKEWVILHFLCVDFHLYLKLHHRVPTSIVLL